ncbi:hypothetical protein GCM10009676_17850 [Prauserella halophila]|uniref:Uncharacterized protein n=1 Tax=Prauserella halophila TaxID=185641 RepID=A0ABP4GR12_9PSEU|nr:hypothetical protein [Prauserella halophila]MCP2236013.1 hypothetical protein [Prauserella halophila]
MSVFWGVLSVIGAIVVLIVVGIVGAVVVARVRFRRLLRLQEKQSAEFPTWARDHGYEYSENFPESEVERTRGMGALRPFSDFVVSRAHHVFYDVADGKTRFVFQLSVFGEPHADAPQRGALTVAVAELPAGKTPPAEDVHLPANSRGESSIHARGRWVTSFVGGPLTFASMDIVTGGLDRHLDPA